MRSTAVLPQMPAMNDDDQASSASSQAPTFKKRVIAMWEAAQINNRGKYSTARMGTLRDYCRRTSLARALAVCVLTPAPALLMLIVAESFPLSDPADGWQANISVSLRIFMIMVCGSVGSVFQMRGMVPTFFITWKTITWIAFVTGCGATLVNLTCAILLVFPLPFSLILTTFPFQGFFLPLLWLAMRNQDFSSCHEAVKGAVMLILIQSLLALVYTAFSAVFELCSPTQQTLMILPLAVIKVGMKNLVAWLSSYNQDTIAVVVVFTAEVFNAMYVSICMQMAVSGWTSAFVITLDAGQAFLSLMKIYYTTNEIQTFQKKRPDRPQSIFSAALGKRKSRSVGPEVPAVIKLHSPRESRIGMIQSFFTDHTEIRPLKVSGLTQSAAVDNYSKVVEETRKLMFHSEYLMLVEYVECAIPGLYAVYLLVLAHLPNVKYYPHAYSLSPENLASTVGGIILYAALESLALVGLHVVLKHRFGFSPLHQLAFALETDVAQVQGRLCLWILALPQFTLVHFGADFSFRFEWIYTSTSP